MGDIKGLTDKRKSKESKYVLDAGKLKIGMGMISHDENILIPLNAISYIELLNPDKFGQDAYELKIQNHAGTCFYITAWDFDFIKEIRCALMICMNDKGAVYSAVERLLVIEDEKLYGDKISAAAHIRVGTGKPAKAPVPVKNSSNTNKTIAILDDEWETLKDYSLQKMKDFSENERNYTICEAMAASANLKNKEKCKKILEVSGNDALDVIIAGAPISVKAIINKLM